MNFNFILDENYLAYFILNRKMHNESKQIEDIKNVVRSNNDIGYKKILEEDILDDKIYLSNIKIKELIDAFILTDKFNEVYKLYQNESKYVVAIKILKNVIKIMDDELENIKEDLWVKYMDGYRTLLNMNCYNPTYFLLDNDVKNTIEVLKETDEFKKIYVETELYLQNVKKYWEDNQQYINEYLKNVLRIDLNLDITVYISHPDTCEGYFFGSNNIAWGHYKGIDDPNYNLIYLVHEGLHCLLPFEPEENDIEGGIKHTVIELISDYELFSLLKGESTLNEGHPFLDEYRKFIYPYWLRYIGLDNLEINHRLEKDGISLEDFTYIDDIEISNKNIKEFIEICVREYYLNIHKYSETKITK